VNVQLASDKLTYRDVRKILALLDAWPSGSIHFEDDGLVVDAIANRPDVHVSTEITSPAVGIFRAGRDGIGHIEAPQKSTPVVAPEGARVVMRFVQDGAFVEYGQPLVLVMR